MLPIIFVDFRGTNVNALSLYSCQLQICTQALGSLLSQTAVAKIFTNKWTKLISRVTLLKQKIWPSVLKESYLTDDFIVKSPQKLHWKHLFQYISHTVLLGSSTFMVVFSLFSSWWLPFLKKQLCLIRHDSPFSNTIFHYCKDSPLKHGASICITTNLFSSLWIQCIKDKENML